MGEVLPASSTHVKLRAERLCHGDVTRHALHIQFVRNCGWCQGRWRVLAAHVWWLVQDRSRESTDLSPRRLVAQ